MAESDSKRPSATTAGALLRQLMTFTAAFLVAFVILVRTNAVQRLAYQIEKGRIAALRESLPSDEALAEMQAPSRAVAATVAPAVVRVMTEQNYDMADLAGIDRLHDLFERNLENNSNADVGTIGPTNTNGLLIPDNPAHRSLLEQETLTLPSGFGSGFIIDADEGYIVTNDHVIAGADTIRVHLSDGRRLEAHVLGRDPRSDVALIQIDASNLHELPVGDSGLIEVGDDVLAVGNPFGLDGSFSRGIISAKGRSSIDIHGVEYKGFLQTDAVINPGNSGGPLVNMRGEVIGMNTAIATESGHYDGVGFAIPAKRILQLVPSLVRGEPVLRGYLGVSIISVVDAHDAAHELGWEEYYGVIIREVLAAGPAESGGMASGDVVLEIDGHKMRNTADLIDLIGETPPGETVDLLVWRDGAKQTIRVEVGQQPEGFTTRPRILPTPEP